MPVCSNCKETLRGSEEFCPHCGARVKQVCPNCKTALNGSETFCPHCGASVKQLSQGENIHQEEKKKSEKVPVKTFFVSVFEKVKAVSTKYKKQILAAAGILLFLCVGVFLYDCLIGFERLSWNDAYLATDMEYVTQAKLQLGVKLSEEEKANDIVYEVTCGEVQGQGLEITWNLSDVTGRCKIAASYKHRKLEKEFLVLPLDLQNADLSLENTIDDNSDEDLDYDGLTNKQEKEYGTNPVVADSDLDGLDDYYEIFTSETNPNERDSDGDGLTDGDEVKLGLNPNKVDSKDDGINDGQRLLTYNYESDGLKLSVTGKGNIASTVAEVNPDTRISEKQGLINKLYTLYTGGEMQSATLTISYTAEELKESDLNEENLSIYYYNEQGSKYEKVDSTLDKQNKTVSAKLEHFSNYVLGDSAMLEELVVSEILFVLDNSWSMYNNEQYEKYTHKTYPSQLPSTDPSGVRFKLTGELTTRLAEKNYRIGLSEFRRDYANAIAIGGSAEQIKQKLGTMTGSFITSIEGTNIGNALTRSINEFSKDSDSKYIVILTDGQDDTLKGKTKSIINAATSAGVKICSIGFGDGSDNAELSNISNSTGCKFYSSGNAMGLTELFENIGTEIDDDLVDVDGDHEVDGILIADSGFLVNRDGFSFDNYGTSFSAGGHCYGMASVAQLYYKKVLPLDMRARTIKNDRSYPYNLRDTYFEDYANLYDYKLRSNILKYTFGFEAFDEEKPADFRKVDGDVLAIADNYRKELVDSGMYDIVEGKSSLTPEEQLEKYGFKYKTTEDVLLNEDKMQNSENIEKSDKQLLNAIYASFIRQNATTHYSSASNFVMWARNVLGTESTNYTGADGFINILKMRLKDDDAPVISADFGCGFHAINAISLVQDIDNPNIYHIGVYDNNYSGEKRYVSIECTEKICVTRANDYYDKSGEPIRVTPSLEYDLEYYR